MESSSKRGKGCANVGHCLVDGCSADLSVCREYHRRHKVCEAHSKTPKVRIGGREQRFCQQCSRFHSLVEFDEGKRSCRKRLDGHNRRRRKRSSTRVEERLQVSLPLPQIVSAATASMNMGYPWSEVVVEDANENEIGGALHQQQLSYLDTSLAHQLGRSSSSSSSSAFVSPNVMMDCDAALSLLSSPPPSIAIHYHQPALHFPHHNVGSSHQTLSFMWD